jgi:hypothetical protein
VRCETGERSRQGKIKSRNAEEKNNDIWMRGEVVKDPSMSLRHRAGRNARIRTVENVHTAPGIELANGDRRWIVWDCLVA